MKNLCQSTVRPKMAEYIEVLHNLALSVSQQVTKILYKDTGHKAEPVKVGNWVLQKTFKINCDKTHWQGPYKVAKAHSHSCKYGRVINCLIRFTIPIAQSPSLLLALPSRQIRQYLLQQ